MLKGLLACVIVCGAASPALAGERDPRLAPDVRNLLQRDQHVTAPRGVAGGAKSEIPRDLPTSGRGAILPTPAAETRGVRISDVAARYQVNEVRPLLLEGEASPEVTMGAGGSYAVSDALSAVRKPRFRRSPLGALLVLRIDGQEESPAFSVGGGGVAAAVWRMVPRP
jgi:hypothetical protein